MNPEPAAMGGKSGLAGLLLPWLSTIGLLLAWHLAATGGLVEPRILPPPAAVFAAAAGLAENGQLGPNLLVSALRVFFGVLLGLPTGLALGVLAGLSRAGEHVVDRPVQMLRAIPFTALTPLFILWFGLGEELKVLFVAFGVAIPVYINTFGGIRDVDRRLVEVGQVYGVPRWQIALTVLLPGALPTVLIGVRFALGIAWIALIVAESVNADRGIGFLLNNARQFAQTEIVILCILLYALLGLLTDAIVRALEHRLLGWRQVHAG